MTSDIVSSILRRINQPDLLSILADDLAGNELNSILLEVFNRRASAITPPALLNQYQENRFVKPGDLPVVELKRMELEVLELFQKHSFQPVELSPVSMLGSCSVIGPVDQKKVLSALRGTEVLADSTNALALHASDLIQKNERSGTPNPLPMRLCNIQRQLRTQANLSTGFTPHFRIGCLVTCGKDAGGLDFEQKSLHEHIQVMTDLFLHYYKVDEINFKLLRRTGQESPEIMAGAIRDFLLARNPDLNVTFVEKPLIDTDYYKGLQYKVNIVVKGNSYEIADGGFVDWTQQLLQNKKQRMLSTGFGFDLMYRIQSGSL